MNNIHVEEGARSALGDAVQDTPDSYLNIIKSQLETKVHLAKLKSSDSKEVSIPRKNITRSPDTYQEVIDRGEDVDIDNDEWNDQSPGAEATSNTKRKRLNPH
jgi:hypothetical protein